MYNPFRKKKYVPQKAVAAESYGVSGEIAFVRGERSWDEKYNLVKILAQLFREKNIDCGVKDDWILVDGVILLRPEMQYFQPLEPSGVRTTSIIFICHETLAPEGFFEYQHSTGEDTQSSFRNGFSSWIEIDLPAIRDALGETISECMTMKMSFDDERTTRTAVLSPVSHLAMKELVNSEEHPFCPCCLLTKSFEQFRSYFESSETVAIRLLAVRDEKGNVSADCRINGVDYPDGEKSLMEYAKSWPERGYETRKQYVVIRSGSAL